MALITGIDGLELQTTPSYANQEITSLESSNEDVVGVVSTTSNGVTTYNLVPKREGTATITATLGDNITTSTTVTVTKGAVDTSNEGSNSNEGNGESSTDTGTAQVETPVTGVQFHSDTDVNYLIESLPLPKSPDKLVSMASFVSVYPTTANQTWILSSSDSSILRAQSTGVYALKTGTAILTARSTVSPEISDSINVTVYIAPVESVSWLMDTKTLTKGTRWGTYGESLVFVPEDSKYSDWTITSLNPSVVAKQGNELVAIESGTAQVKVTAGSQEAILTINVPAESDSSDPDAPKGLNSFSLSTPETTIQAGSEFTIQVTGLDPSDYSENLGHFALSCGSGDVVSIVEQEDLSFRMLAANVSEEKSVRILGMWVADDSRVSSISSDPLTITVSPTGSSGGGSGETITTLSVSFQGLSESGIAVVGNTLTAIRTVVPSGYPITYTRWTSRNTSVATIDNSGRITCVGAGVATIQVEVDGVYATKDLYVGDGSESDYSGPWDEFMKLQGTNLASPIVPFTSWDEYPTHYAKYGKGGYRSVGSADEMRGIVPARREEGMLVWVMSESQLYQYRSGMFIPIAFGGNGSIVPNGGGNNQGGSDNPGGGSNPGGTTIDPNTGEPIDLSDIISRLEYLEGLHRQADIDNRISTLNSSNATISLSNINPSDRTNLVGTNVGEFRFTWGLNLPSGATSSDIEIISATITPKGGSSVTYDPSNRTYRYSPIPNSSPGTWSCSAYVTYLDKRYVGLGDQYDLIGGKKKNTSSSSVTLTFGYKIYYGSTTLDIPGFSGNLWDSLKPGVNSDTRETGIRTDLPEKSSSLDFRYTVNNGRAFVAFPKAFVSASTAEAVKNKIDIVDSKGDSYAVNFEIMSITVPGVNDSLVDYWLYYLAEPSTITALFEFKFFKI